MRRRRVMRRGEPGGRLKPRDLRALARVSIVTTRPEAFLTRSWTMVTSSSRGAVCGSSTTGCRATWVRAGGGGLAAASDRGAAGRSRHPPRPRRLDGRALHDVGGASTISGQGPEGEAAERDAEAGRDVADGVEGAVVRYDLDHVARA